MKTSGWSRIGIARGAARGSRGFFLESKGLQPPKYPLDPPLMKTKQENRYLFGVIFVSDQQHQIKKFENPIPMTSSTPCIHALMSQSNRKLEYASFINCSLVSSVTMETSQHEWTCNWQPARRFCLKQETVGGKPERFSYIQVLRIFDNKKYNYRNLIKIWKLSSFAYLPGKMW